MSRGVTSLAALALLAGAVGGHCAPITFTPADGSFHVQMPKTPKETVTQGSPIVHEYAAAAPPLGYLVAYFDIPPGALSPAEAGNALDEDVKNMAAGGGGKLLSVQKITFHGFPGRACVFQYPRDYALARVYLIKNRVYHVVMISTTRATMPKNTDGYFRSFRPVTK